MGMNIDFAVQAWRNRCDLARPSPAYHAGSVARISVRGEPTQVGGILRLAQNDKIAQDDIFYQNMFY